MNIPYILPPGVYDDLKRYLVDHEADIAFGINDFGDLKDTFELLVGREPS